MGGWGSEGWGTGTGFGPIGELITIISPILNNTITNSQNQNVDLLLDANGDLDLSNGTLNFTTGLPAVTQGCSIRLKNFKGEWFLDLTDGMPYFQDILGQKFNKAKVYKAFRNALISTPGVIQILKLTVDFDNLARKMNVSWSVQGNDGTVNQELLVQV